MNDEADLGVSNFICSLSRSTVVACSVPLNCYYLHWVSEAPGALSPATNIIRIFTFNVWMLILLSTVLLCIILHVAAKIGTYYGLNTESYEDFLVPFR